MSGFKIGLAGTLENEVSSYSVGFFGTADPMVPVGQNDQGTACE